MRSAVDRSGSLIVVLEAVLARLDITEVPVSERDTLHGAGLQAAI